MLTRYELKLPKAVYSGENVMENLTKIVKGLKKVALFTDKSLLQFGLADGAIAAIKAAGAEVEIFSDLKAEPTYEQVQAVVDAYRKSQAEMIVGLGGGSVIDATKLTSLLAGCDVTVKQLLDNPLAAKRHVPTVMIPSTAGTGAEASPIGVVAVPEKELKVGIVNPDMIPDTVILDANLIKNLPRKIAAATGLDALAHAVECYTSKKANPFSDTFALEALDIIINNLEKAVDDPNAFEQKTKMFIAAFYAGIALTASGVTGVHALSYPLGGKYHIAHGVSNAILLVPVMKFNEPVIRGRLAQAYDRVCHDEKKLTTDQEKSAWMIAKMDSMVKHLDIPTSLKEFGVKDEDIDGLVSAGMEVTRLLVNNMREITPEAARSIYLEIM